MCRSGKKEIHETEPHRVSNKVYRSGDESCDGTGTPFEF